MITLNNIGKKYRETVVLENASYTFPQKGIVCLMGASGSGKTTILNLLAGFDTDYEGEIIVAGTDIHKMNENALCEYRRNQVGFVFQNYHLLLGYTVLENVTVAGGLEEDAKKLLSRLAMTEKEKQRVENLSGGQKQRVAIARALMNNPRIIFADEPTGALDRTTSNEIMELFCEIARERLVVIITHDQKICDFADEIIHIQNKKIVVEPTLPKDETSGRESEKMNPDIYVSASNKKEISPIVRAKKNFKVHIKRYLLISTAIAVGMFAYLFSLSFGNVMDQSIEEFKMKNTAFSNGYIKGVDDEALLESLKKDDRIFNVYYQYMLSGIKLSFDNQTLEITEKFPMPKTAENLSYGIMPRRGKEEIAITPSLAKKFDTDIKCLLGKKIQVEVNGQTYSLMVSGIYNAGYDDFFVSSDIEEDFYKGIKGIEGQENYSISYDVKEFSDIVAVSNELKLQGVASENDSKEVDTLQKTFNRLKQLFVVISILIMAIGIFICTILLVKLQNTRYHEVGLLSALGFERSQIVKMIFLENILISILATGVNLVFLIGGLLLSDWCKLPFIVTELQILLSIVASFMIVLVISGLASYPLVHIEPAEALKK